MKYRVTAYFEELGFVHIPLKATDRSGAIAASKEIMSHADGGDYFVTEIDGLDDLVVHSHCRPKEPR